MAACDPAGLVAARQRRRARAGAPGACRSRTAATCRPYVIDIVRVEPQGYASFRWASAFGGAEPAPGTATLVEFYLRPVGDDSA